MMRIRRALLFGVVWALLVSPALAGRTHTSQRHDATAQHKAVAHKAAHATNKHKRQTAHSKRHTQAKHAAHPGRHVWTSAPKRDEVRPLIVIDPGHGGTDPGAIGVSGTMEKTVTLATAIELRRQLLASGRYRVALTRTGDRSVSLANRLAFAQGNDADLMIAIHADASPDRHARGASVYVRSGEKTTRLGTGVGSAGRIAEALSTPTPRAEPGSAWLQYSMIDELNDDVRMVAAPARTAHLYVLGSRDIPSVLLEMGFLSNRQDEALLKRPGHRNVLVEAMKDAIDDYFAGIRGSRT
jgi:N-acetylmuramoyl-L-alanine amidase